MNLLRRSSHILRSPWLLVSLITGLVFVCKAQSPADGRIEAHAYVNTYLHFTYSWPAMLQPRDVSSLQINAPNRLPGEFELFAAQQSGKPYGIVVISEKLHAPTPHNPTGFKDGADFLSHVGKGRPPEARIKILDSKHTTTPDGLPLDELDYSDSNEFDSAITIEIGQYLVVFKCNAQSPSDLSVMTKSILATHRSQ